MSGKRPPRTPVARLHENRDGPIAPFRRRPFLLARRPKMSLNRLLLALPVAALFVPAMAHASGDVGSAPPHAPSEGAAEGDLQVPRLRAGLSLFAPAADRAPADGAPADGERFAAKKKKAAEPAAASGDVVDDEAPAADPPKASDGEEVSTALPDDEVKVGGTVLGDSVGGATGFVFKQGIYTQSDLGGFFVIGNSLGSPTGFSIAEDCGGPPCAPVPTSQLQPYIGLSVGYDIQEWLGVQLSFGTGFVANAAVYDDSLENPRDYGLTNINLAVVGSFYVLERLAIMGKVMGGATFISPEPLPDEPTIGGNAGFGVGVRYATLLPDVFVGIDGNVIVAVIPSSGPELVIIPGISFAPVIKYVF